MSCYNWESGSIVIPSSQWRTFRKSMIEAWNKRELLILELAKSTHKAIKDKTLKVGHSPFETISRFLPSKNEDTLYRIENLIYKDSSLHAPKKQDLQIKPTSKGCVLHWDECSAKFDDENCTLHWSVSENNHAVDRAHEHPFTHTLFQALNTISWKRGSGGVIVGNDEYNQDNSSEGGGGNYVTRRFGPNEIKPKQQNTYGGGWGHGFMGGPRL